MNAATSAGVTALHKAASKDKVRSIELLIGIGATVDARDKAGVTPLMMAAREQSGNESCAVLLALLQHGAIAQALDVNGNSPLHWAAFSTPSLVLRAYAFVCKARLLLEWGADETAVGADGRTPAALARTISCGGGGVPTHADSDDPDAWN